MKNRILFNFLFATLLFPFLTYSQETRKHFNFTEESHNEKPDDPYLPNAYNDKKVSPAYRYDNRLHLKTSNTGILQMCVSRVVTLMPGAEEQ